MMNTKTFCDSFFVIADSHIDETHGEENFFSMLSRCANLPPHCAVVFLGDIFELWFAVDGYESGLHRRFVQWCETQSAVRTVVFLEGNHEFYISQKHRNAFTFASACSWRCGELLFAHGDRVNRADWTYALLRAVSRNNLARFLLYLARNSFGPALTQKIRLGLKQKNMAHKKFFPKRHAEHYLARLSGQGIRALIAGHFHEKIDLPGECVLHVLPAWFHREEAALFDISLKTLRIGPWRELLPDFAIDPQTDQTTIQEKRT